MSGPFVPPMWMRRMALRRLLRPVEDSTCDFCHAVFRAPHRYASKICPCSLTAYLPGRTPSSVMWWVKGLTEDENRALVGGLVEEFASSHECLHDWRTEMFRTSDGARVITFRDCQTCGRSETLSDVPTP